MKLTLVNLPSPFLVDERVFPPLGLLSVATAAEQHGHEVNILDLSGHPRPEDVLEKEALAHPGTRWGISATTPQYPFAIKALKVIREANPKAWVALGGPHVTVCEPEYYDHPWTAICKGDGESFFGGNLAFTGYSAPCRSFIDVNSYLWKFEGEWGTSLVGQRGCPFNCAFCCGRTVDYYRKVRARSPKSILSELDHLHNVFGYSSFMFYDDEININNDRLRGLCEALSTRDYKLRAFIKAELFNYEQASWMEGAGFKEICTGMESGDEGLLKIIDKTATPMHVKRARAMACMKGIKFKVFTIVGLPGETEETALKTRDCLIEMRPDSFDVTVFTPYPGSRIWDDYGSFSHLIHFDRSPEVFFQEPQFYKGKPGDYRSLVSTPSLSSEDIVRLRDQIAEEVACELKRL